MLEPAFRHLAVSQNSDGGWNFGTGSSWLEPTAYALLACRHRPASIPIHTNKAILFLESLRLPDGGWSPHPGVRNSTWVTCLALHALHVNGRLSSDDPAIRWLLQSSGAESTWVSRLRSWLVSSGSQNTSFDGWPWYVDTAAWVAPTAASLIALQSLAHFVVDPRIGPRIHQGREFLLARRCADGGWNHGSNRALGYDGDSYPETTGMALAALQGTPSSGLQTAYQLALQQLKTVRSVEAWSWLVMGLRAHKILPEQIPEPRPRFMDPRETALFILAVAAP